MAKAGFKYASYEKIKHFLMPFKNPELVNFLKSNYEKKGIDSFVLFDVGANYGQTINIFNSVFGKSLFTYAFEPNIDCNDVLCSKRNVLSFNVALSSESKGFLNIYIPYLNNFAFSGLASSNKRTIKSWFNNQNIINFSKIKLKSIKIQTKKLDEFIHIKSDIIKIDVQGMEHLVLKGAKAYIKKYSPDIIVELEFDNIDKTIVMLYEYGYIYKKKIHNNDYFFSTKKIA